jgi:hypothetical protein
MNRNKLIELFVGNLSNAIIHKILEKSIEDENIRSRYNKELANSIKVATNYRNKINPINAKLNEKDIDYIKDKILKKVKSELNIRIKKGYSINLGLVEGTIEEFLKQTKII